MMFDGFQDNVMQSTAVEDKASTADSATEKTIIETSGAAATGGPNPEGPNDDDNKEKDFKVEKTENLAVSEEAIHSIGGEARK